MTPFLFWLMMMIAFRGPNLGAPCGDGVTLPLCAIPPAPPVATICQCEGGVPVERGLPVTR
jgi:hypothetical protein